MREEKWLRASEAAKRLKITRQTLYRWTQKGYIAGIKQPSGQHKYQESEVERVYAEMLGDRRFKDTPRAL
jgi:excisionase family DNA binding protein